MAKLPSTGTKWLLTLSMVPSASVTLFCFPHSGASANTFFPWISKLPNIQVFGIQYPGRNSRFNEKNLTTVAEYVEQLLQDDIFVEQMKKRKFAFFGHSFGSIIAYELCRELRRRKMSLPIHFWASSRNAPHLPVKSKKSNLSEQEFLKLIELYGGTPKEVLESMKEVIIPILRADWGANENYIFLPENPLPIPITTILGDKDTTPDITEENVIGWKVHTSYNWSLKKLSGDHFYLTKDPGQEQIIQLILSTL